MSQGSGQYDINLDVKINSRGQQAIDSLRVQMEGLSAQAQSLNLGASSIPQIATGANFSSNTARTSGNVRATTRPSRPLMIPNNAGVATPYPLSPPGGVYFGGTGLTPGGTNFGGPGLLPGGGYPVGGLIPAAPPPGTGMPGMNPLMMYVPPGGGYPGSGYSVGGPGGNMGTARLAGPGGNWAAYQPPPPNPGGYNPLAFGGYQMGGGGGGWGVTGPPPPGGWGPGGGGVPPGAGPGGGGGGGWFSGLPPIWGLGTAAMTTPWMQRVLPGLFGPTAGLQFARGFGEAMLFNTMATGSAYLQAETQQRLTGRGDLMAQYTTPGRFIGGALGAGLGALFGGYGAVVGMGIGQQLGAQIGEYIGAPNVRQTLIAQSAIPIATLSANWAGDWGRAGTYRVPGKSYALPDDYGRMEMPGYEVRGMWINPAVAGAKRIAGQASFASERIAQYFWGEKDPTKPETYYYAATPQQMATGYQIAYESALMGGLDPERRVADPVMAMARQGVVAQGQAYAENAGRMLRRKDGTFGGFTLIEQLVGIGTAAIGAALPASNPFYIALTHNLAARQGDAAQELMKSAVGPILAATNQLGGAEGRNINVADAVMRFGPISTARYLEAITPIGQPPVADEHQLAGVWGRMQRLDRSIALEQTHARGVGAGLTTLYGAGMLSLASLPEGDQSLAYAQMNAKRRAALLQSFEEEDITGYAIPMTRLSGARQRAQLLPYNPGGVMGLDLRTLAMNSRQITRLSTRMERLRREGDLSESTELDLTRQIESMRTTNAAMVADLAQGFENRLPAYSAGRPAFFGRMSTMAGAAFMLGRLGSPVMSFGAWGGTQTAMQEGFVKAFGQGSLAPGSGGMGSSSAGMNTVIQLLQRIADSTDGGKAPTGSRPYEGPQNAGSQTSAYSAAGDKRTGRGFP